MMPRSVDGSLSRRCESADRCPPTRRRRHRHRERALHRPRAAVERELADDRVLIEQLALELPAAGENADGDRQIERAGTLRQLGRGQIDHDAILRPHEAAVDHRPLDAMRALLHRLLGQADEHRLRQRAGRDIDLDFDRQGVDAQQRKGVQLGEHGGQCNTVQAAIHAATIPLAFSSLNCQPSWRNCRQNSLRGTIDKA